MLAPRSDVTIDEAERLIFLEAELLDEWRLDDWLKLYTGDMTYLVPTPGHAAGCVAGHQPVPDQRRPLSHGKPGQSPEEADGTLRISTLDHRAHVRRTCAWPGKTTEGTHVNGVFHVSRYQATASWTFSSAAFDIASSSRGTRCCIRYKRCDLGMDALVPQGRLTIVL